MQMPIYELECEGQFEFRAPFQSDGSLDESGFEGPFWKAIKSAHEKGVRGQGNKIAVIDSGCDRDIAALNSRVERFTNLVDTCDEDFAGHGTKVAQLVAAIAPESSIHVYKVVRRSSPGCRPSVDEECAIEALELAMASDVNVINLSFGHAQDFAFDKAQLESMAQLDWKSVDAFKSKFTAELHVCAMCTAATNAARSGKLVFAAAGNRSGTINCPARAVGIVGVGFQQDSGKIVGRGLEARELAYTAAPKNQAIVCDIALREIDGLKGTSFASPMYAAAAALGINKRDLNCYLFSLQIAELAISSHMQIKDGSKSREFAKTVEIFYQIALRRQPHAHGTLPTDHDEVLAATECWQCGIFAYSLHVNYGLWLIDTGRFGDARKQLEIACRIAPWSPEAHANLGAALFSLGEKRKAIEEYKRALRLRPGFSVYADKLKEISCQK